MIVFILALMLMTLAAYLEVCGVFLVIQRYKKGRGPSRIPFPIMWILYAICVVLFPSTLLSKAAITGYLATFHLFIYWIIPFIYVRYFSGLTRLHKAILHKKNTEAIRLIQTYDDVNRKDKTGWTPLHYAADSGVLDVVDALLRQGANVNASANTEITPLHIAVKRKDINMVKLLLSNGANPGAEAYWNNKSTPRSIARNLRCDDISELLESNPGY